MQTDLVIFHLFTYQCVVCGYSTGTTLLRICWNAQDIRPYFRLTTSKSWLEKMILIYINIVKHVFILSVFKGSVLIMEVKNIEVPLSYFFSGMVLIWKLGPTYNTCMLAMYQLWVILYIMWSNDIILIIQIRNWNPQRRVN